ncbi:MAG: glycosyltransferase family 4 protein [Alphaproteobacteria bacterium]|nr:glycosyltransferase family 4 protein [Alphaproteobacteria bacterium]
MIERGDRVAFYAPLKPPHHPVPSGDRRMARALMAVLAERGRKVELASRLRSFDRDGDHQRQTRIQRLGARVADRLITGYRNRPASQRPNAWITYHAYHKSPDWLGSAVRDAFNIPYLLVEASFAPKQAGGPWDLGHRAAEAAIRGADVTLAMTEVDQAGLSPLIEPPSRLMRLPPFLDPTRYRDAFRARERHRRDLAERYGLNVDQPWLLAVGMMRDDVKRHSYALLADTLRRLDDRDWQLLIVGDGASRSVIEKLFASFGSERVKYAGILDENELPACYAAADVYAWPAIREAYGMALLEAQASGLPVVAGREGGVADVMRDGITGMLTTPRSPEALASALANLLDDPIRRRDMSAAALEFVEQERSLGHASTLLDRALIDAAAIHEVKAGRRRAVP